MKRFSVVIAFVLSVAGASSAESPRRTAASHRETVDIVITHGTVITMAGPNIDDGSVAIDKHTIVAVGKAADISKRFTGRETIDAHGEAILPGFVNGHTHTAMTLFRGIADDRDLMDWLTHFIFPAEAKNVTAEFVKWGARLAAVEMIESGTTTFADMYYFESDIARETKRAGLRGILGETLLDFPAPDNKTWDAAIAYTRKYIQDWKGDALITPALAPHAPFTVSREHLQQVRRIADELHAPILIHVSETKDELRQVAEKQGGMLPGLYLNAIDFLGHDVIAAHGVWLTPEEIRIFAEKKVGVVHNPISNMMLASGVAPVLDMRKAGVNVGLGTDGPAGSGDNLDMIETMATAARLQKVMRSDPKAMSARDVLEMATIAGARALGLDDKIGTLEAGKRADVIVIDLRKPNTEPHYDVESAIVYSAFGSDVTDTICDGQILMRSRKVLTVNVPETLTKAREYRDRIVASLQH